MGSVGEGCAYRHLSELPWLISALLVANQDLVEGLGVSPAAEASVKSLFHSALLSECQNYVCLHLQLLFVLGFGCPRALLITDQNLRAGYKLIS